MARSQDRPFAGWLERTSVARVAARAGITSAVCGEESGVERLIPFDIVPRIIPANEWKILDRGLRQRVQVLNAFLHDAYHDLAIPDMRGGLLLRHPLTDLTG